MAKYIKLALFFISLLALMYFNYSLRNHYLSDFKLESFLNTSDNYTLKIVSKPKQSFNFKYKFIVEIKQKNPNLITRIREIFLPYRILATANVSKAFEFGDILSFDIYNRSLVNGGFHKVELQKLSRYQAKAYKKDKVYFKLKKPELYFVSHEFSWIYFLQNKVKDFYFANLSDPNNARIVSSLLMGTRVSEPPANFIKAVRKLGLGHFFAASGFHLLTLTLFLMWIFKITRLPEVMVSWLSLIAIFLYSALAGFSPSIVRAAIMLSAYFLLKLLGRKVLSIRLLCIIAVLTLLWDPYTFFDIGFQFSYLSTLAILIWASPIQGKINFLPGFFADILSVTLAVQLLLLPLVMFYFGTPQVWTILANLIFSPFLSLVVVLSFVGAGFLVEPLLNIFRFFVKLSEGLPMIDYSVELFFWSFVLLLMILNIAAYLLVYNDLSPVQKSLRPWLTSSLVSLALILVSLNLNVPQNYNIKVENKQIKIDPNLENELSSSELYRYQDIDGLRLLRINDLSSLKALSSLINNMREVNILILPNLKAKDIYLGPLLSVLKPEVVLTGYKNKSSKVKANLDALSSKSYLIANNGSLDFSNRGFAYILK